MKKLLLIAFTLFSMNTFAQTPMLKATKLNGQKAENSMKFETSNRVNLKKANSTNKVKAQAAHLKEQQNHTIQTASSR